MTAGVQPGAQGDDSSSPSAAHATEGKSGRGGGKGFLSRHKRLLGTALLGVIAFGFAYYVLPQIVGLGATLERLRSGNLRWLVSGVPLEAGSYAGYVVLFHSVLSPNSRRIGWGASYEIAMAGGGATKLLAAAGSGGVMVTAWALDAAGLSGAETAQALLSFNIINYAVYMAALVIGGGGLWLGVFAGKAPLALTLIPAIFGLAVIIVVLSMLWWAGPVERFILRRAERSKDRAAGRWRRLAGVPRALERGVSGALVIARGRDRSWLAAIPAWGFDIAVLWVSFRAFGHSPPAAPLVLGYYVGTLGNLLPLPGGIGGVEGGMIGAFIGFGVSGSLAVLAVLAYRTISYWIPALPEGTGYLQLRRRVSRWRALPTGYSEQVKGDMQVGDTVPSAPLIRPIQPDDETALAQAFEHWSTGSRYRRFLVAQARLSRDELRYLTEVDHHRHEALVAVDPDSGELIGVARYIRSETDPQVAEVAFSVADERQGQGVGGQLAAALAARAREEGVTTFTALELAENETGLSLLRDLGDLRILRHDGGTVEVSVALARPRPELAAKE